MTLVRGVWVLVRLYLMVRQRFVHISIVQTVRRQIASLVGFALLILAAIKMAFGLGDSRNLLAIAAIVLVSSATTIAWELLLALVRTEPA